MNPNEQEPENSATLPAGGDVITKSASQVPSEGKRAGGDVITKGPSQRTEDTEGEPDTKSNAAAQGADIETRAGGDVITKSPSQKQEQRGQ
jgi:hypothetical protein